MLKGRRGRYVFFFHRLLFDNRGVADFTNKFGLRVEVLLKGVEKYRGLYYPSIAVVLSW